MILLRPSNTGFTLIELVSVIVLFGIISITLVPILTNSVDIYQADNSRAALIQKGRLALERIAREVREAVPNSLEVVTDAFGNTGIQFLQARSGGKYIAYNDNYGAAFSNTSLRLLEGVAMSQLYIAGTAQTLSANDSIIIGNTSPVELRTGATIVSANNIAGTTVANDGTIDGQILGFPLHTFNAGSPGRHYFLSNQVHEVGLSGNALYWHTAAGTAGYNLVGNWSNADPMLVDGVTGVIFTYAPGNPVATAVMRMSLTLTDGTEVIRLYQEVHIRNTM